MALRHTCCALLLTASCTSPVDQKLDGARGAPVVEPAVRAAQDPNRPSLVPLPDHHKHLPSPAAARLNRGTQPLTADQLIAELDAAGIRHGVVLSVAYWFGNPSLDPVKNEYEMVRAENDWTVRQTRRFSDRLVPFCSFNPLKAYALAELERCAADLQVRGLKLHFNSSAVDLLTSEHVEKVRQIFRAANERQLAIVVHVRGNLKTYGREHAEKFLNTILPAAHSIPVQITHLWGGEAFSDSALAAYAAAVSRGIIYRSATRHGHNARQRPTRQREPKSIAHGSGGMGDVWLVTGLRSGRGLLGNSSILGEVRLDRFPSSVRRVPTLLYRAVHRWTST